jgi:hypothetical protein
VQCGVGKGGCRVVKGGVAKLSECGVKKWGVTELTVWRGKVGCCETKWVPQGRFLIQLFTRQLGGLSAKLYQ